MSTLKTNRIEPVGSTAGTVTVDGTMVFTQGATFPGGISVGQAAYFSSGVTVAGGISVSGNATFSGTVFMGSSAAPFYGPTGNAPIYGARAWVTFNTARNVSGTLDTTSTNRQIFGSGNVASVQRVGEGDLSSGTANLRFRVTFTTPMPNANYAVTGMATQYQNTNPTGAFLLLHTTSNTPGEGAPSNKTTTSFDVILASSSAATTAGFDNHYVSVVVFG